MNFTVRFGFSEQQFTWSVQGLIFLVAAVYMVMALSKARRTGQRVHLKWLAPLAIYTIDEAITYAIANAYTLLNVVEPEPLNTITDAMDDVALVAFLWGLIVLWRMIRSKPELLQTPWLSRGATPEGIWPPAPEVRKGTSRP